MLARQAQAGVQVLGVLEVHQRLVQQYVHVGWQPAQQFRQPRRGHVLAGGVVGVADRQRPCALADGLGQAVEALHRHRPCAGARGHQRVERVGGPRHRQLITLREQSQRRGLQQLGRPIAQDDALGLELEPLGQPGSHAGGVAVRVAVHAPTRGVDRGVHDLRVRKVRPLGARQVHVGYTLQRQLAGSSPAGPRWTRWDCAA